MDGGTIIVRALKAQGIQFIYTLCGGHISPLLVAGKAAGLRVVDVRHESAAVFAADATARITGIPGVAAVTAGPGITNTVTAVKNAQMAQSPLILLGGAAATVLKGRGSLQDIDQRALLAPVVKRVFTIKKNCDIMPVMEHAFKAAVSGVPGPVFVECPIDTLYAEDLVRAMYGVKGADAGGGLRERLLDWYLRRHVDRMFACTFDDMQGFKVAQEATGVKSSHMNKARALLARSQRPVMIIGSQAMLHPDKAHLLAQAVRALGIPVYLAGMARGLLGVEHPLQMRHRRGDALKRADLVILAGMPSDFRLDYGRDIPHTARLLSINRSRRDLYLNRRPDLAVNSDPFLFLCALAHDAHPVPGRDEWMEFLAGLQAEREAQIDSMARLDAGGFINPVQLLRKVNEFMTDGSVLVVDGGDFAATAAYTLRPRAPLTWLDPGVFGTLGIGGGFAVGAKLARPGSEVWIVYGDGACAYSLHEFDTLARHGAPVIALVGNDAGWTQIARDQVAYLHDDVATRLARTDYHIVAEGFGGKGLLLKKASEITRVLREARRLCRKGYPVLINAHIGATEFRKGSLSM